MSSNSSNSSTAGGNTKPPPKQDSPKKRWCLTLNNYNENELSDLISFFSSNSSNKYIIGKEVGELKNTPHLQCYCNFSSKIRFTAIKKINERLHIEPCRGNELENIKYCSKEGNYISNMRVPKPLKLIDVDNMYPYQYDIIEMMKEEPNDRNIIWCYGDKNIGKTQLLKYICAKMFACILPVSQKHAQSQIHKTHEEVDIYVFNLTADESEYQKHELFSTIESIKDGLFSSSFGTETNGMCLFNSKHVLVMGNKPPDLTKTEIDINRFNLYEIENDELELKKIELIPH
jgi:hypothetical protein